MGLFIQKKEECDGTEDFFERKGDAGGGYNIRRIYRIPAAAPQSRTGEPITPDMLEPILPMNLMRTGGETEKMGSTYG